jgi:hypothetical protein
MEQAMVLDLILSLGLAALIGVTGRIAFNLYTVNEQENQKNKARYTGKGDFLRGKAKVKHGPIPDGRVIAGIAYDRQNKRYELNGKLSDEVVDQVLGI